MAIFTTIADYKFNNAIQDYAILHFGKCYILKKDCL